METPLCNCHPGSGSIIIKDNSINIKMIDLINQRIENKISQIETANLENDKVAYGMIAGLKMSIQEINEVFKLYKGGFYEQR